MGYSLGPTDGAILLGYLNLSYHLPRTRDAQAPGSHLRFLALVWTGNSWSYRPQVLRFPGHSVKCLVCLCHFLVVPQVTDGLMRNRVETPGLAALNRTAINLFLQNEDMQSQVYGVRTFIDTVMTSLDEPRGPEPGE